MTTTPAPTDLDTLKALLADATTEGPWGVEELRCDDKWVVFGGENAYSVGTAWSRTDADLIAAMRNALPALLDELAEAKREIRALTDSDDAQVVIAQGERDAAREELAKTRAELDAMTERRDVAVENAKQYRKNWDSAVAANMTALETIGTLKAQRDEVMTLRAALGRAVDLMLQARHYGNLPATLRERIDAFTVEKAEANPATTAEPTACEVTLAEAAQQARLNLIEAEQRRIATAEPADEPKATCSCIVQPFLAPPRVVHLSTCEAKPAREQCEQVDCHNFGGWQDVCGTGPLFTDAEPAAG